MNIIGTFSKSGQSMFFQSALVSGLRWNGMCDACWHSQWFSWGGH